MLESAEERFVCPIHGVTDFFNHAQLIVPFGLRTGVPHGLRDDSVGGHPPYPSAEVVPQVVDREGRNAGALHCVPPSRLHASNGPGWILRAWKHEIADAVHLLFPPAQDVKRKFTEWFRLTRSFRLERPFKTNETGIKIDLAPRQAEQFAIRSDCRSVPGARFPRASGAAILGESE